MDLTYLPRELSSLAKNPDFLVCFSIYGAFLPPPLYLPTPAGLFQLVYALGTLLVSFCQTEGSGVTRVPANKFNYPAWNSADSLSLLP